ncbi:hypothetical protein BC629DRAFT_1091981 [Irpex lacteus]|nr:hypothetical protein BC629DRAFT_1091981 [Irpex lacteus]
MDAIAVVREDPFGPLNLQNTFGAGLLGAFISVGLLGITTLQAWLYYRGYPGDGPFLKIFVGVIVSVELARSSLIVTACYHYLVLEWGNIAVFGEDYWALDSIPLMNHIAEVLVHSYFALRIWMLSRAMSVQCWVMTSVVVILTWLSFALGIVHRTKVSYVILLDASSWVTYGQGFQKIISPMAFSASISTDIAIMVFLIVLLNRGRTGVARTEKLLNTLMFYIVQAGMITVISVACITRAADAVIITLDQLINRVGFSYMSLYAIVGNLYANSFLASLNARESLRTHFTADSSSLGIVVTPIQYAQPNIVPLTTVTCRSQEDQQLESCHTAGGGAVEFPACPRCLRCMTPYSSHTSRSFSIYSSDSNSKFTGIVA